MPLAILPTLPVPLLHWVLSLILCYWPAFALYYQLAVWILKCYRNEESTYSNFWSNNGFLHLNTVTRRPQNGCQVVCPSESSAPTSRISLQRVWRELWCVKQNLVQSSEDLKLLSFMKSVETPNIFFPQTLPVFPRIWLQLRELLCFSQVQLEQPEGIIGAIRHTRNHAIIWSCSFIELECLQTVVEIQIVVNLHTHVCPSHTQQRKGTWADAMRRRDNESETGSRLRDLS